MKTLDNRGCIELFHLLFLRQLVQKVNRQNYTLKGGCNLRFFFKSPRYSEDMDLDIEKEPKDILRSKVTGILKSTPFMQILLSRGIEIEHITESKQTDTTQRWKIGLMTSGGNIPLPTKIEFSRRGAGSGAKFEAVDPEVVAAYGIQPLMVNHYAAETAFIQKVEALTSRSTTQARDIFDLHLLLAGGLKPGAVHLKADIDIKDAQAKAMSLGYGSFKSQVVAFLMPEDQAQYDSPAAWDGMVLNVVEALGKAGEDHETN